MSAYIIPSPSQCLVESSKQRETNFQHQISLWLPIISNICKTYDVDSDLPLKSIAYTNVSDFTDKLQEILIVKFKAAGWNLRLRPTIENNNNIFKVMIEVEPIIAPLDESKTQSE